MRLAEQPENLTLHGYDLNDRLNHPDVFSRGYDLINSRFVNQGINRNRWNTYIRDMKALLRRGGWVQLIEYYPLIQSDSGLLTNDSAVRRWWANYEPALAQLDRDPRIGRNLANLLIQNGYQNVVQEMERLPIGGWDPSKATLSDVACLSACANA